MRLHQKNKSKKRMIIFLFSIPVLIVVGVLFMQQKAFGQNPQNDRLTRIEKSPNYKKGKFHNLVDVPVMSEEATFFKLMKLLFSKHENTVPSAPIPVFKSNLNAITTDSAEIIWFGHSSYLIKTGNRNILVDPVFSKRASPVSFTGVTSFEGTNVFSAADMPKIDILVITHDHYDHMDYKTIMQLQSKTSFYIVPLGVGQHLESWGIDTSKIKEFDWWDEMAILSGISIACTPAQHFSGRGFVRNKTLWASFVLKSQQCKIFIGGDSGYGKHFKQIGEKYGPFDIALLECGQYGKYWPYIHSMPEETVQASIDLKSKVLMPVHWGKFKLSVHPWDEPIKRVSKKAAELNVTLATPMIGEPLIIQNPKPEKLWVDYSRKVEVDAN
jgi:L-ascorbate metabolism protein UlaG (beta-lactamase superfamily)